MQADKNNFCGDVDLVSFKKASEDEDNTVDQIHKCDYVRIILIKILILYNMIKKCIHTQQ